METLEKNQLEQLLEYENEDVLSRFLDLYNVTEGEARDILKETLKFLYISQIPGVFIPDDLLVIDEMWHNLILFTPEYHKFSQKYFSQYFHHIPARKQEKEDRRKSMDADPDKAKKAYLDKLEKLISVTYDHLGEDTVRKWFEEYPVKYSKEQLRILRK
ncbi:hypothetical protein C900_05085 [Fulvivirga imtechensis AK7]|uniref:Uncharacterized protein n=1 Tax=Fulvivirga imtechensis AK7 TaxID=1237149 RepID=L8JKS5_9BACT|nr:hypothetical protein [Fulvivirga imtechensis]ELR69395.1 hypothetical protein C900_05085 [Fulvivirga imtechensis AK7]